MIEVTELNVRSFDLDHLDLFWKISGVASPESESQPHEIWDYEFYVLRSDSPMGPFERISNALRDTYRFRDVSVSLLAKWRPYYYKIEVVHRPTGEITQFGPTSSTDPAPDLIASEAIRQEDMIFREFIGRKCYLFPIRNFGPYCTCYNRTLGRRTRSGHKICFGTGWLGGYHAPIEIYLQIDPNPKVSQHTPIGELQPSDTTARMTSFPPVSPGDIVVELENRRWRVGPVNKTERLRSVVRQELSLHEIPKGDIEYELPVKIDLETVSPSAERNFTNPQNPQNEGDYSDILAAFGHPKGTLR